MFSVISEMASLTLLLHLLLMVSAASAWSRRPRTDPNMKRFFGGSLTVTPKGRNSDGTYEVELRDKQTVRDCFVNHYTCYYGHCGSRTLYSTTTIAQSSNNFRWCQHEVLTKRKLSSNLPFGIRYPTQINSATGEGYWVANRRSSSVYWRMMAHIDLGTRSDTGKSNRAPLTTILPILRVPINCPRSFNLNMFDPDGDQVRCRVATHSNTYECGLCGLMKGFSFDQNSCTLNYTSSTSYGHTPFELVVEDFPNRKITVSYSDGSYTTKGPLSSGRSKRQSPLTTTTTVPTTTALFRNSIAPLSKLPLQFLVHVDQPTTSCTDGDFFPIFLAPTPIHGANLPAFVNQNLNIKVKSRALYTVINRLILTGPKGISSLKISKEEYVIKWKPTENEVNDHFPVCFIFESYDPRNSRGYQSELRCVTVDVGRHNATVTCNETTMKVEVEKTYLIRRFEDSLHLNDFRNSSCNLTTRSNSTHLVAVMSLNACGTLIDEDDSNIIFKNEITSADTNGVISRQHEVEIAFSCAYPKVTNLTLGFVHKNPYAFTEKGFGAFTFQFEFFESERFRKQVSGSTYPMEVYLKQMIFMQIEATTSIPNTELFVESCRATPYDNPNSRISYAIIQNGCVKDNTVQIYPSSRIQFRFGMEAFEFIGAHEEVYITCSVILCESGISGTRCSKGCVRSTTGNNRRKRGAVAETSSHSISQGPLHLLKTSDSQASGLSLNLSTNIVFIVGCLLACGVVIYRSRRSDVKYQPLPTSDTD